ncbi:MAG: hypothetical protein E7289_01555 [Lachnospiraceae bacterium]|nr:hypothetical protein [Lachnospiraceae bacterium]
MVILQSILVFVHMCVIPYLIGCLFFGKKEQINRTGVFYVTASGLMVSYALFELLVFWLGQMGKGFRAVSNAYLALVLPLAAAGLIRLLFAWKKSPKKGFRHYLPGRPDGYMMAAFLLIAVQIGAILYMATPDKDDAFYSGLSSMSLSYDWLLERDAYGGLMASGISRRYMVSALPVYQAMLSLFSGMHHLVISHNLFPLFYMPLAYGLFYGLGKRFLEKEGMIGAQGKFLFAFALLHMVGNYFVFSPENFLVTRIWQGKALFVAIGIPMLWMSGQEALFSEKRKDGKWERLKSWVLVACVLLACTFMGETGLFLGPFMLGCQTLAACLVNKNWKKMIPAILCCVPEMMLFGIYLM